MHDRGTIDRRPASEEQDTGHVGARRLPGGRRRGDPATRAGPGRGGRLGPGRPGAGRRRRDRATRPSRRRWPARDVVASDLTPELLERGRDRPRGAAPIEWQEADAEALPFDDGEFDAVLSCVGVMFAPHHQASADELVRVCRPGGTIGLVNWTPAGLHRADVRDDEAVRPAAPARCAAAAAVGQRGARPRAVRRPGHRRRGAPADGPVDRLRRRAERSGSSSRPTTVRPSRPTGGSPRTRSGSPRWTRTSTTLAARYDAGPAGGHGVGVPAAHRPQAVAGPTGPPINHRLGGALTSVMVRT